MLSDYKKRVFIVAVPTTKNHHHISMIHLLHSCILIFLTVVKSPPPSHKDLRADWKPTKLALTFTNTVSKPPHRGAKKLWRSLQSTL